MEISRVKTDEAQTVTIVANDASGFFTVASSVSFAAGDSIAKIPVTFDFSKLQADTDYDITLTAKDAGSEYGDFVKTITIKYAPWTDWEPYGWDYPSTAKTFAEWEAIYAKATTEAEYAKDGIILFLAIKYILVVIPLNRFSIVSLSLILKSTDNALQLWYWC